MDFIVSKSDLSAALNQILQGRKETSAEPVDLTADHSTLAVVATGRNIEVPAESQDGGSASVPIGVLFGLRRISGTYKGESFRIRIQEGKLRFQSTTVSNPGITMKKVARRIIDIPADALPKDILSLPLILSVDEIEDCGLHGRLLLAQKKMAEDLDTAAATLHDYGFDRNELSALAKLKIKANADTLKRVLFSEE